MSKTASAKKALRQSVQRRAQNAKRSEAYKAAAKAVRDLARSGKKSESTALLPALYAALDKAAKTNAIKKNKASRIKSRLTRLSRENKS